VIHEILETLYSPHAGKQLQAADIEQMKKGLGELVRLVFGKYFPEEVLNQGKNLLAYRVSLKFIQNFLATETQFLKEKTLFITELEKELSATLETPDGTVLLKGTADRIDRTTAGLRIIDYKTGKAEDRELKVNNWEDLLSDDKLDKSFQLLCYAWMYQQEKPEEQNLYSGIITFRELSAGFKAVSVPGKSTKLDAVTLSEFASVLQTLLSRLFDKQTPFTQTSDRKTCEFCGFQSFCSRN
jgi:ATP-dependent helicase/nuclease subunit B